MVGLLDGKKALVMGVANDRSIAWAIAKALADQGAELIFTYQGERLERRVRELAEQIPGSLLFPCDVSRDEDLDALKEILDQQVGALHVLVHSIAFAKTEELSGLYVDTSREGFAVAQEISVYSLTAVLQRLRGLLAKEGGSVITMTYMGSERVMPNYNVMGVAKAALESSVRYLAEDLGPDGIRVNAISAGPIRTLSAKGIKDFNSILKIIEEKAPLRRNTDPAEVGDTAVFLASSMSRGITGEIIHVDNGYHIMGV
ncbi:enoyl-[acyl-carrier-protein] reductase FabI [Kyrpidia spormannii]|uniref:Enoyl-[acyl-carrier-protein] reductase [NADH] n=2 Tax=Kyrpidia spormannii TaxID=2055160 RepID=A0A2K8N7P6_9BACL|nr:MULTISPECIES: enoyl-ACP reductase FabI [Kyrpidia]ATY85366.1 enoyl-[acyl-carrier-protein] reductase FabI [Kyrpidia spormannii]CAB3393331.1 enoyl-acyl carrier protein reductase [Kyrpidia spormannii]CAB3394250.1 enoyl-acyl carrier protein reductase [Kyrpidia spormannii]